MRVKENMKNKTVSEIFSINLRKIRMDKGLSQEKLAELCKLDRTYISSIERNKKSPSLKVINALVEVLEILPEELFKI